MKTLFTAIVLFISCVAFANSKEKPTPVIIGKIETTYYKIPKNEDAFKTLAIATLCDNYLQRALSTEKYNSITPIQLEIQHSSITSGKFQINMMDSILFLQIEFSNQTSQTALKLLDFALNNSEKLKAKYNSIVAPNHWGFGRNLLNNQDIEQIMDAKLNDHMKLCLEISFDRFLNNKFPQTRSTTDQDIAASANKTIEKWEDLIYEYKNDTFHIYCKKNLILKLNNIQFVLQSNLGLLIFDTFNSFYYFNLNDNYVIHECNLLSKRHEIGKKNEGRFYTEDEDITNNRICFYTYESTSNPHTTVNGSTVLHTSEKIKYMYLINDDFLIQDFHILENQAIDHHLSTQKDQPTPPTSTFPVHPK